MTSLSTDRAPSAATAPTAPSQTTPLPPSPGLPPTLTILTLNCWGLKYISTHRTARLTEIGRQIALTTTPPDLVCLQECWTAADYASIATQTASILPHAKFYHSGCFGSGLAILSRWPFEETRMVAYPLNGRPTAFFRGDWFVGKGVACARVRVGGGVGREGVVEVFNTHLHAPYNERGGDDSYRVHRTAQAWEVARLMRHAGERGHGVVAAGDFNMLPGSLAGRIVGGGQGGGVEDVWVRGGRGKGRGRTKGEGGEEVVRAVEAVEVFGTTCDSKFNTWRWAKQRRKDLGRGRDWAVDGEEVDGRAKRLDYVFFRAGEGWGGGGRWAVEDVRVGMRMRHPELLCSLSDHFSVEATLRIDGGDAAMGAASSAPTPGHLPIETYDEILAMIEKYMARERKQKFWREAHFIGAAVFSIACFVAVWWSPANFVAFLLLLLSTLGFGAGVIDGLMGLLFFGSEIRALKEFDFEIRSAREMALRAEGRGEYVVTGDVEERNGAAKGADGVLRERQTIKSGSLEE